MEDIIGTVEDVIRPYVCYIEAGNLTYTIVRSTIFCEEGRIEELLENVHACAHENTEQKKRIKKKTLDRPILKYWDSKVNFCEDCTSFLSEIFASSWRHYGPDLAKKYNYCHRQAHILRNLSSELVAIMADLFKYMSIAYERLEKETKDALQAETHSSDFTVACNEYFGLNFDTSNDAKRLEGLLTTIHETNINLLLSRLFGGQHIADTIERDKKALSKGRTSTGGLNIALCKDEESQTEQQGTPTPTKGKNHDRNKKRSEARKKKRANAAENSQAEASTDTTCLSKEPVDISSTFAEHRNGPECEGAAQISPESVLLEALDIAPNTPSPERVDRPNMNDDIKFSPAAAEQSMTMDCPVQADLSEAFRFLSISPVVADPAEEQIAEVALENAQDGNASYQHEEHLEANLEIEHDQSWTQVVGSRKKSKKGHKSGFTVHDSNSPPLKRSPRFAGYVNKPRGGEKSETAVEIGPPSSGRAQTSSSLSKLQESSKTASNSTDSRLSGSTKLVSASTVPEPSTPKKKGSISSAPNPTSFSPSESIDPGPKPYYQHLKPFTQAQKMADATETTIATTVAPLTNTVSLVESLRGAGVENEAMSSLVPRAGAASMSSTHLPLPNTGSGQFRLFAGKQLDVRRANRSPRSAGNSPVPPQPERKPFYDYPPPDVLTPENQEILDLIKKGPPYKKYPKVPTIADQQKIQPLAADFVTKKPPITTYDGKDAYEVLGDRCPAPLTIKDHPNVNKCIQQGETFHCAYCRVEISGNAEVEKSIICPGCGPCSETRYCQTSHLLADSISHSEVCGKMPGTYPLMWSELPLHFQSLYPYIEPLTGTLTAQCFRQIAHCLVINSDGIIQNPFRAYFDIKMAMEDKVKCYHYVKRMYQFQDKASYYIFHPNPVAGGVDIDFAITVRDGSTDSFREDQRFARVRNAAFLTLNTTLLCALYRRVEAAIEDLPKTPTQLQKLKQAFRTQFLQEFPSLDVVNIRPLGENYKFQDDWSNVRHMIHDMELGNPILRAWITEDDEDDGIPADPIVRYQGKHWDIVHGPTFRAGSVDRRDWGAGWYGGDEKKWQKQLDRKYLKMVTDELAQLEIELEGEII